MYMMQWLNMHVINRDVAVVNLVYVTLVVLLKMTLIVILHIQKTLLVFFQLFIVRRTLIYNIVYEKIMLEYVQPGLT